MNNLGLYNKYREVPKDALKPFDNGKFKGTDINTMWRIKCLTEEFGPCGLGWYLEIVRTWSEQGSKGEVLAFAEIRLFVRYNGEWSAGINATGGSKLVEYVASKDYHKSNDEGYKMAITDALGVACKLLGFGADVYWANDKTKYTTEEPKQAVKQPQKQAVKQEQAKPFTPLTKAEMMQVYGIKEVEKTLLWLEAKIGGDLAEWNEAETAWARAKLQAKKDQKQAEKEEMVRQAQQAELPF